MNRYFSMKNFKNYFEKDNIFSQVHPRKDLLLVLGAVIMGTWFGWGIVEIFVFALLIFSVLRGVSSRLMILPAILFLVLVVFLLLFERNAQAEEFSVYAYYFLGIAIILALKETWRSEDSGKDTTQ